MQHDFSESLCVSSFGTYLVKKFVTIQSVLRNVKKGRMKSKLGKTVDPKQCQ